MTDYEGVDMTNYEGSPECPAQLQVIAPGDDPHDVVTVHCSKRIGHASMHDSLEGYAWASYNSDTKGEVSA